MENNNIDQLYEAESIIHYLSSLPNTALPEDVYRALVLAALRKIRATCEILEN